MLHKYVKVTQYLEWREESRLDLTLRLAQSHVYHNLWPLKNQVYFAYRLTQVVSTALILVFFCLSHLQPYSNPEPLQGPILSSCFAPSVLSIPKT